LTRILFVTWDGPQVHYLESLFLPIFERLKTHGLQFDVLQFRWGDPAHTVRIAKHCRAAGIGYRPVPVHRSPPVARPFATAVLGRRDVRRAVRDFGSDLLMPRSLMPALAVLAAGGRRLRPMIYDADGLEADERVDFRRLSRSNPVYRLLRAIERRAVADARTVLVRTPAAAEILADRAAVDTDRFHVVTNGRDPDVFRPASDAERRRARAELAFPIDAPVLAYAGSIGPQYRFDLVAGTFAAIRERAPEAQLLVLTSEPSRAVDLLERHQPGIGRSTEALSVEPERVPFLLGAADAGLSFRSEAFSTRAIAPVKLGEYLLCGLPVIGTGGVGPLALSPDVFFDDNADPDAAAEWLLGSVMPRRAAVSTRARAVGVQFFSIDASVRDYRAGIVGL
jgi:glycosyltransferase involved in cell wall biosynthesis